MPTLRNRIKEILSETGLKPVELARLAGVTRSAVQQWIDGGSKTIKGTPALNIEERLGYSARWVLNGSLPKKGRGLPDEGTAVVREGRPLLIYYVDELEHQLLQAFRHLQKELKPMVVRQVEAARKAKNDGDADILPITRPPMK